MLYTVNPVAGNFSMLKQRSILLDHGPNIYKDTKP
jgi:hypothetical protein